MKTYFLLILLALGFNLTSLNAQLELEVGDSMRIDNEVHFPIIFRNFTDFEAAQFGATYNHNNADFLHADSFSNKMPGLSHASFFRSKSGKISVVWFDPTGEGIELTDNEGFQFKFEDVTGPVELCFDREFMAFSTEPMAKYIILIDHCHPNGDTFFFPTSATRQIDKTIHALSLSPNPVEDQLYLTGHVAKLIDLQIEIFNVHGNALHREDKSISAGSFRVPISLETIDQAGLFFLKYSHAFGEGTMRFYKM